jgi:quinol monooxygenase YgiN
LPLSDEPTEENDHARHDQPEGRICGDGILASQAGRGRGRGGDLSRFAPQARGEPGVRRFTIHRSRTEASKFFFYEVFDDEAAFAAHQQTAHFKTLIAGEALPKLANRERVQYAILQ